MTYRCLPYILFLFAFQLGVVLLEQGKHSQALAYLDKALEFDPDHEQALLNSAILLQELGQANLRKLAEKRLLRLLSNVRVVETNERRRNRNVICILFSDFRVKRTNGCFST